MRLRDLNFNWKAQKYIPYKSTKMDLSVVVWLEVDIRFLLRINNAHTMVICHHIWFRAERSAMPTCTAWSVGFNKAPPPVALMKIYFYLFLPATVCTHKRKITPDLTANSHSETASCSESYFCESMCTYVHLLMLWIID